MGDEVGKPVDVVDPMGYTPIGAPKILKQIKGYDKYINVWEMVLCKRYYNGLKSINDTNGKSI